jgi:hypothetical protein
MARSRYHYEGSKVLAATARVMSALDILRMEYEDAGNYKVADQVKSLRRTVHDTWVDTFGERL